jgi:hypothetical protein
MFTLPDRLQNRIGAAVLGKSQAVIGIDDDKACDRKSEEQLRMFRPDLCTCADGNGKYTGNRPYNGSAQDPEQDPLG